MSVAGQKRPRRAAPYLLHFRRRPATLTSPSGGLAPDALAPLLVGSRCSEYKTGLYQSPLPQVEFQEFRPSNLEESKISTAVRHTTSCSLPDKLVANVRRSHFSSPLPRASHSLDYFVFRKLSSAVLPGTHTIRLPYQLLSRIFLFGPSFGVSNLDLIGSSLHS